MSADDPFRLTIWERRDDDGPRLVYADWLEERGDCDRAELIRLQCRNGDESRVRELVHLHGESWAGPAARHSYGMAFRRGFVEEITLEVSALLNHGEEIFAAAPIRLLRVIGAAHVLDRFLSSPLLARVEALHLTGSALGDAGAIAIAGCEHLRNLRTLRVGHNSIGDDGAEALADSPSLAGLEALVLQGNLVGDAGAVALATSRTFARLRHLDLSYNPIGDAGAEALAHAADFPNLKRLDLSRDGEWFASRVAPIHVKQRTALAARFGAETCIF